MTDTGPAGTAYRGIRERVAEVLATPDVDPAVTVPCCPEWSVADLVGHMAGVVDDVLGGRLEGAGSDSWTNAQVEARKGRSLDEVLAEWHEKAPAFEGVIDAFGITGWQAVFDAATHEHDLRGALGQPGARDSDAVAGGLDFLVPGLVLSASATGVTAPRIRVSEDRSWGDDDAPATLTASPFEVMRALSGRRSAAQIRALDWEGDVDAVLPAFTFGPFRPSPVDVEE